MKAFISGVQQVGVGVVDAGLALPLYRDHFGMAALVFDDIAEATLMAQFTGNIVHERRALLTLNMQGGGGFEVWQYTARTPVSVKQIPRLGDLGITEVMMNASDVAAAQQFLKNSPFKNISAITNDLSDRLMFTVDDPFGNRFRIVQAEERFSRTASATGGVAGVVIGVSNMDRSLPLYRDVLGISETVNDVTERAADGVLYRRVLLRKRPAGEGGFGRLLGSVRIELVQCSEEERTHIYTDRYWGDPGFIHLCLDVLDMDGLKAHAAIHNVKMAVDSKDTFDMENAGGRFCYIEDPDGTLIELVETHRVPVLKKLGIYINLKKRDLYKPLPDMFVRLLALNKVK